MSKKKLTKEEIKKLREIKTKQMNDESHICK